MGIAVEGVELTVLNTKTRMPFKYGIASMTAVPHLFLCLRGQLDQKPAKGVASEGLVPKWFTKDPATTFEQDIAEMVEVIRHAGESAIKAGECETVFDLWQEVYRKQEKWGQEKGHPALLWSFGVSVVERALIDAFCRGKEVCFWRAVRENELGIRLGEIHEELSGQSASDFLRAKPLRSVKLRHTIGLADVLTEGEVGNDERIADGLPQTLEGNITLYGLTHFKVKLFGQEEQDLERLGQIAAIIKNHCSHYVFTLDGNEQYKEIGAFRALWEKVQEDGTLREFFKGLLFVEQPFHRDVALSGAMGKALRGWRDRPAMIIDESDATLDSVVSALAKGYAGTSHKNCKGVIKGIANACLIEHRRRKNPRGRYVNSVEDLCNIGPIALLQDFAVAATLGIDHVERNGHQYFCGLSMFGPEVQEAMLKCHGDLYRRWKTEGQKKPIATVFIKAGRVNLGSVVDAPFGVGIDFDCNQYTQLEEWTYESLVGS